MELIRHKYHRKRLSKLKKNTKVDMMLRMEIQITLIILLLICS